MTTKLNLTIEKNVVKKIKAYATSKRTSVSKLAEDYFGKLTEENNGKKTRSFAEEWSGFLKKPVGDLNKAKDDYLKEKHGL